MPFDQIEKEKRSDENIEESFIKLNHFVRVLIRNKLREKGIGKVNPK